MARARKEVKKPSPEERNLDLWNQQVFLMKRKYADADRRINAIKKSFGGTQFSPTPEATEALRKVYYAPTI